ncbi:response regulator transcription factor [Bacillus sp. CGMCC 1.16607]|uniref:response regulator transcription factor n=1 Tax=Bacillus sp. CGMCC 1.16607 TaxID=3351842 RepID=UPI003631D985
MQPKILIAEDEEVLRQLLCMYLKRENYLIEEVDNGAEALEKGLMNDYDLIILDILMPGKDGLTVLKELRKVKATPIVILTVEGGFSERTQGIQMGATDYIFKPFSPAQFVKRIKEILESNKI